MNKLAAEAFIKQELSKKRYTHSVNVAWEAEKLARRWGGDTEKAFYAGLVHDICKEMPLDFLKTTMTEMKERNELDITDVEMNAKALWHAPVGGVFVKQKFGVNDIDIINSIRYHTTGRPCMTLLEEIVYMADMISADREFKEAERIRKLAYSDWHRALYESFAYCIEAALKKEIALALPTVEGHNYYLAKCAENTNNTNTANNQS
jgi:nicotinate-nucleotide adenylyltransferase